MKPLPSRLLRSGIFLAAFFLLFLPSTTSAATVAADSALTLSEASPGNAYLAGMNVRVTAPVTGDVAALATDVLLLAPVSGDALLFGGTVEAEGPVGGDLRAIGARVRVNGNAAGDIFAVGGSVRVSGKGTDMRLGGLSVDVTGGANGPVTIFGASVSLAGDFAGDVRVFASDRLVINEGTRIRGTLEYDAPQQADIPDTAVVDGGVVYTGSSSFLPTKEEARTFAIAGAGLFLAVRIVAAMLMAGLAAGLIPAFANDIARRTLARSPRRFILLALLGFAVIVATPILVFLLALSFVGIGIALALSAAYLLLLILAYVYAGICVGALIARIAKRTEISWRFALAGMLVLNLVGLIPVAGIVGVLVLSAAAAGALVSSGYRFAFGRDTDEP